MASTRSRVAVGVVATGVVILAIAAVCASPFRPTGRNDQKQNAPGIADDEPCDKDTDGGGNESDAGGRHDAELPDGSSGGAGDEDVRFDEPKANWSSRTVEHDLVEAASQLLTDYRDAHDCVLVRAGYLDLFANVWGCVVSGPGWVELCVVSSSSNDKSAEVRTLRMGVKEWGQDHVPT